MKMQIGVRVESEVWRAYRALCGRERLRPSVPVEEFLRLVLENGSALGLLAVMRVPAKERAECVNAQARVLLDWYTHEKYFFNAMGEDYAPVEGSLLEALKAVTDSNLRRLIEEALIAKQQSQYLEKRKAAGIEEAAKETPKLDEERENAASSESVHAKDSNVGKMQ
jgi:hypothetical protein